MIALNLLRVVFFAILLVLAPVSTNAVHVHSHGDHSGPSTPHRHALLDATKDFSAPESRSLPQARRLSQARLPWDRQRHFQGLRASQSDGGKKWRSRLNERGPPHLAHIATIRLTL
jgi:hypothetical protein